MSQWRKHNHITSQSLHGNKQAKYELQIYNYNLVQGKGTNEVPTKKFLCNTNITNNVHTILLDSRAAVSQHLVMGRPHTGCWSRAKRTARRRAAGAGPGRRRGRSCAGGRRNFSLPHHGDMAGETSKKKVRTTRLRLAALTTGMVQRTEGTPMTLECLCAVMAI